VVVACAPLLTAGLAVAQRRFFGFGGDTLQVLPNVPYDGRFTFARLKYTTGPGGYYYWGLPAWAHGYGYDPEPATGRSEQNLMKIMNEISYLHPRVEQGNIFTLDDPELCKYPIAYMTEAGFWELNDKEAAAFRAYLQKGGFLIVDDFRDPPRGGGGWANFEANFRRVIPDGHFVQMDVSHPIFHSFFEIASLELIPQYYDRGRPQFRGLFEDNDPQKRLMVIANFNTDISNFWEFSNTGFKPIDESNEAYKLGVNYIIYGLTH